MPRYSVEKLIRAIEEHTMDGDASPKEIHTAADSQTSHSPQVDTVYLRHQLLPTLGQNISVNRVPLGARFSLLKKIYLKLFSPFLNRQEAYNAQNLKALEELSNCVDKLTAMLQEQGQRTIATQNFLNHVNHQVVRMSEEHEAVFEHFFTQVQDWEERALVKEAQLAERFQQTNEFTQRVADALQDSIRHFENRMTEFRSNLNQHEQSMGTVEAAQAALQQMEEQLTKLGWVANVYAQMEQRIGAGESKIRELETKCQQQLALRAELSEMISKFQSASLPASVSPQLTSVHQDSDWLQGLRDLDYHQFQLRFRGTPEILQQSQRVYVELLKSQLADVSKPNVLDLGCGDGAFLSLLQSEGWSAQGVDSNSVMSREATERGIPVQHGDMFEFLQHTEPKSYDAVCAFQVIEHLKPRELRRLLELALPVLKPGGLLLLETINPNTLRATKWYYLDPTHERLVAPEMLGWLCEAVGFQVVEWKGMHPVEEVLRLQNPQGDSNINKLNEMLFGDQDYYFLARKV
ncbi:MAG: methyltransferase domain-containing protein [Candidatus Sumerlaeia bacterium]|nr:methyltransferase domain-containing protein [Candidatus Sumerlaeia bacterium]